MMSLRHKVSMVLIKMNIASNTGLSGVVDLHNAVSKHNKIISMYQMLSYNLPISIFGLPNVASREVEYGATSVFESIFKCIGARDTL